MVLRRHADQIVRQRLAEYPAVTLVGPRQCGKTTLAQSFGSTQAEEERF